MKRLYTIFYAIFFVLMCFTSVSAQTPSIQATYSCVNTNATLSVVNVSNVTSYTWRNASTLVLEGTTATLTKASGSYTVTIIQASGSTTLGPYSISTPIIPATSPTIIPPTDVSTPLCGSASRTITASGATTYSWKQNNVSLGISSNSLNVVGTSVATEGTYNFTVTAVNAITGCESASSASVSLKLSPTIPSTPTISGLATFCTGASTTLTSSDAGTGGTYLWSNNATTKSITTSTTGAYTVKTANSVGCQSASSTSINITQSAVLATPTITGTTAFCAGDSTTLTSSTAGTGGTYLWNNGKTTQSIVVKTAGTFNVKITNSSGCSSAVSTNTTTTVNTVPTTPTITGATAFCTGDSTTLTSSAAGTGGTYLWSNGKTTQRIVVKTVGTFNVKVTNSSGCASAVSTNTTTTVNAVLATPTITGATAFCTGDSTTLTSSTAGTGGTYLWNNGKTTQRIVVKTAGTFNVQITNSSGCASAVSTNTTTTVNALPTTPTITGTTAFCAGDGTTLTSSSAGTGGTYLWNNGSTTQSISVTTAGIFNVKITNSSGCTSAVSTNTTTTVNALPTTPTIIGTTAFCAGDSTTLTSSAGSTGDTYLWNNGKTTQRIVVKTAETFNVKITNSSGCTSPVSTNTTTTVNTVATPTITGITTFCSGDSTTLTSSSAATGGTYLWNNGKTTQRIVVKTAGTFNVKITNSNGCTSAVSNNTTTTVNALPTTPTITGTTAFCAGDGTTLTSSSAGAGGTYLWNNGSTTQSITVKTAGTFNVKITNSNGCTSAVSTNTTTTVNAVPTTPTITGITTICSGDSTTLTSSAAGTGGSYLWSNNKTSELIVVKTAGSYTLQTISSKGCYSASSATFVLNVNPLPNKPTITGLKAICMGDSTFLNSSSAGTGTYLWNTGKTTSTILVKTAGEYNVRTISALGCKSPISDTFVFTINPLPTTPTLSNNLSTFCAVYNASTFQSSYTTGYNIWYRSNQSNDLTTALNVKTITVSDTNTYKVSNITVKVKAQDVLGCLSAYSNAITLTINPSPQKPTIQTSANSLSFCDRDSLLLTAISKNSVTSYVWNNAKTSPAIYAKIGGNYAVTVTNSYNCSASSDNVSLTVNPLPTKPSIATITGNFLEFCSGDSTTLIASSSGATTFNWSTGQSASLVTYKTTQSAISAIAVSNKGCKSAESSNILAIKMFPRPSSPSITTSGPTEFCPDKSITLSTVISPKSYIWYLNKVLIKDSIQQKITVTKAGVYGLQTTSPGPFSGSCYSIDTAKVTLKVLEAPLTPSIFTRSSTTFCDGGQVILEALAANVNVVKYSWRDEISKQEYATSANLTVTKSGKYSLKVIDNRTCFSAYSEPTSVVVNVLPQKPSILASTSKTFCIGDSTILLSSLPTSTPTSNANKYSWKVDNIASPITGRTISLKTSSIVSVSITDANGCVGVAASDTVKTTVNPLPATPYITLLGSNPFCADKSILLNGSEDVGYKWSTGAKTRSIQVNLAGSYSLQTINKYNCLSKSSTPVTARVNPLPAITNITAQGNTTFCNGDSVKLINQSNLTSYWYLNTSDSLGISKLGNLFKAVKSGEYSVRVQDGNGCLSTQSKSITVNVRALPASTADNTITPFGPFSLEAPIIGDDNGYEWKINAKTQTNYITKVIKAVQGGQYQVRGSITYSSILNIATNTLICYSPWSLVKNYVEDPSYEGLSIYPNPSTSGDFWIQTSEDLYGAEISIHDIFGRLLYTETINEFTTAKKVSVTAYSGSSFIIKVKNAVYSKAKLVFVIK